MSDEKIVLEYDPQPKQIQFHECQADEILYGGAVGGGKLLNVDTPVPTPSGWTTMGELRAGDYVFDEKGITTRVMEAFNPETPERAYRLIFDDGSVIEAGGEHQWLTFDVKELAALTRRVPEWRAARRLKRLSRTTGNKSALFTKTIAARNRLCPPPVLSLPNGTVRNTDTIALTLKTKRGNTNHAVALSDALQLPNADLPLDPYLLGVWLGDGTSRAGQITSMDSEISAAFVDAGFAPGAIQQKANNRAATYTFYGLISILRELNLYGNKHVPDIYLRASQNQRLALLQGLLDTDGTVTDSGRPEFTNTNKQLVDAVHELIVGLGWKARVIEGRAKLYDKDCGPKWDIKWTPNDYVFRLKRKRDKQVLSTRRTTRFRYIIAAEPIKPPLMRCIMVDAPSHLYLAGRSMIPTHNSLSLFWDAVNACLTIPGFVAVIFRRKYTELEVTHIRRARALDSRLGDYNGSTHEFRFVNGSILEFRHCQNEKDVYNYQSAEWDGLYIDELTHFSEYMYKYLRSRVRTSKSGINTKTKSGTNPGNIGHGWVKRRFIDPAPANVVWHPSANRTRCFIPATLDDNPALMKIDPDYIEMLEDLPEVEREALRNGNWDIFAGQYFKEWDRSVHVVEPFTVPFEWHRRLAVDYGFANPFCCLWGAEDGDGTIWIYRELYGGGIYEDDQAKRIVELSKGETIRTRVGDPSMWSKAGRKMQDNDQVKIGESIADTYMMNGLILEPADNNRLAGWKEIRKGLRIFIGSDGKPTAKIKVFSNCVNLIRTLPEMIHDEKNVEDCNTDGEDHSSDCLRYLKMAPRTRKLPAQPPASKTRDRDSETITGGSQNMRF